MFYDGVQLYAFQAFYARYALTIVFEQGLEEGQRNVWKKKHANQKTTITPQDNRPKSNENSPIAAKRLWYL